jgi:hypothetical protein
MLTRAKLPRASPTILQLLGLNPWALKAVRIEHTRALPLGEIDRQQS